MKVAGYVRVSTEKQKKDGSHKRQREKLKNWAERNDHNIDIYEDIAISGQKTAREDYKQLMNNLDKYDAIAVRELSRFGRSTLQILQDIEEITQEHNIEFISLKQNIDTSTAMGRHFLRNIASINELKADLARERTLERYQKYQEEGKDWGRPTKLSKEKIGELVQMREEKELSYAALAKIFEEDVKEDYEKSLDRSTVRTYCKKYGKDGTKIKEETQ